ncbi:MAG TPA: GvpL/GvpF family gas vesicle protein [Amycolatopsis sp.]|jgi:hypothetical protein|nr:GvpL/GvpF family gas vesicle protein [Amycolatopsis sp.]
MTDRETGTWLYAVAGELDQPLLGSLTGVAGEPLRIVQAAGLGAVAGSVPLDSFGEQALRRNFEDLDWLGRIARTHDKVVEAVVRAGPAVPLRLATVYLDDDRVKVVIQRRRHDFERTLRHVAGRTEWGVKALQNRPTAAKPVARTAGDPPSRGAGTAYLQRRRTQLVARERGERFAAEQAADIHSALSTRAVDTRRHRPQSQELSGGKLPMILNAAYLVDDEAAGDFIRTVSDLEEEHEAIRLQLTGPWPPYSFSSLEEGTP